MVTDTESELLEFYSISENGNTLNDFKMYSNQYNAEYPLLVKLSVNSDEYLEVYPLDYENLFDWNEANTECQKLGDGWRLPTVDEMNLIYEQLFMKNIGHIKEKEYWCSNEDSDEEWLFFAFYASGGYSSLQKNEKIKIRPVRELVQ